MTSKNKVLTPMVWPVIAVFSALQFVGVLLVFVGVVVIGFAEGAGSLAVAALSANFSKGGRAE